ncbi:hypothetical protein HC928_20715 [bacterium]|nr:hypothetical protein [bacterium]
MPKPRWFLLVALLVTVFALAACGGDNSGGGSDNRGNIPDNAIEISIIYAPESEQYMPEIMRRFNEAYSQGTHPVQGRPLNEGERPIYITGSPPQGGLSSGGVTQAIVNAAIGATGQNALRPTLFAPSVSHWLSLANVQSRRPLFDTGNAQPTALSPVVIAIWESRLAAIRNTLAEQRGVTPEEVEIGWEELLGVLDAENGWQDYGIENVARPSITVMRTRATVRRRFRRSSWNTTPAHGRKGTPSAAWN